MKIIKIGTNSGSFCTLGIRMFPEFAVSFQISLVEQNGNSGVTQTSERTPILHFACILFV